jgi:hypothetical protein
MTDATITYTEGRTLPLSRKNGDEQATAKARDSQLRARVPSSVLLSPERVHNGVVRTPEKVSWFACLLLGGAAAGCVWLVRVLRPVRPVVGCPPGELHDWRCASYQVIISKPFFLLAGALIGAWAAYAVVRLYAAPGRRSCTLREGLVVAPLLLGMTAWVIALHPGMTWAGWSSLGWGEVLLFLLAAVLVRLAIGIASIAKVRGSLVFAVGLPVGFAGLGFAFITIVRLPPVGHSCPALAPAYACAYQPLIGESGPWVFLGLLAGLWLAYAVAVGLAGTPRPRLNWVECAIALPVMIAVIWWAIIVGPQQAGGGYTALFMLAVCLTALLRRLLGTRAGKKEISGMLTKLGMTRTTTAIPQP